MSAPDSPAAAKRALRQRFRDVRHALGGSGRAAGSAAIAAAAAGAAPIVRARTLAVYVAHDGEPDLAPLVAAARARGAAIALPRMRPDGGLDLVLADAEPTLAAGRFGLSEPVGEPVDPARLATPAVALVPAVALDRSGRRLGRGGGHYDRLLPRLRQLGWSVIGVCHAAQVVESLPEEPHDARVDAVLSDAGFAEVASGDGARRGSC